MKFRLDKSRVTIGGAIILAIVVAWCAGLWAEDQSDQPLNQIPKALDEVLGPKRIAERRPSAPLVSESSPESLDPLVIAVGEIVIRGLVVDQDYVAVASARIDLFIDLEGGGGPIDDAPAILQIRSSPDGRFVIRGLNEAECYRLLVRHDDHCSQNVRPIHGGDSLTLEPTIRLIKKAAIVGTIHDDRGAPLAGAVVQVFAGDRRTKTPPVEVENQALSQPDGSYCVGRLEHGIKRILVKSPGYATGVRNGFELSIDRPESSIDFILTAGHSIAGRVIDETTRQPMGGIKIEARISGTWSTAEALAVEKEERSSSEPATRHLARGTIPVINPNLATLGQDAEGRPKILYAFGPAIRDRADHATSTRSESDGTFVLDGLSEARYRLTVMGPETSGDREWRAQPGDRDLTLEVAPTASVTGRVFDAETGKPLRSFSIAAGPITDPGFAQQMERRHFDDSQGRFIFHLSSTAPIYLHIFAEGYPSSHSDLLDPSSERSEIVVRMCRGAQITGTVRDRDGRPVARAVVGLLDPPDDLAAGRALFSGLKGRGIPLSGYRAVTDEQGRFALPGVPAGRFVVGVLHSDFAESRSPSFVTAGTGEFVVGDLILGPGAEIFGTVTEPDGSPPAGSRVLIAGTGRGATVRCVPCAGDGKFRCPGLPAGTYKVIVVPAGAPNPSDFMNALRSEEVVSVPEGGMVRVF